MFFSSIRFGALALGLVAGAICPVTAQPPGAPARPATDTTRTPPTSALLPRAPRVQLAEAQVTATRADAQTGTAYQTLGAQEVKDRNFGQDLPYLLDQTPSTVTTSDGGTGIGYTNLRIRGSDPTRVNVTLNGVPVNEAESHAVYFVDLPDLGSSVNSIQVQRGVGTSTNGAGAFGGSVNIETSAPRRAAYAEVTNAAGSFGTWRTTIAAGTGLLGADSTRGRFALDARASRLQSEGYVDRAFSRLRSLYLTGTYLTDKTLVRALVLTGQERTGQAWYGVPQDSVRRGSRKFNPAGYDYDDFAGNQRPTPYGNQTDNYQQDYYQLLVSHQLTPGLNLSFTPFYTRGGGYYEEFKAHQAFGKYGYGPDTLFSATGEAVTATDLVRRRWLRTDLYGLTWAFALAPVGGRATLTLGGAATTYRGRHFDEVIWAEQHAPPTNDWRYFDETTRKTDANAYLRGTWQATDRLGLFADAQVRRVRYSLIAPAPDGGRTRQPVAFTFFNPKAGLTLALADGVAAYVSVAVAHREPTRTAYTDTPPARRPVAEQLLDYETGLRRTAGRWQWGVNGYWMQYRNQLVASGHLDDVGNAIPTNVKDSYRAGVELTTAVALLPANRLTLSGNLTLSRNRIRQYTDYVFNYDTSEEQATTFRETTIAYSPSVIAAATLESEIRPGLRIALLGKHVGRQYLDNTATTARALTAYSVADARVRYTRAVRFAGLHEVEAAVLVNNVFGERYSSNGYTYAYIYGQRYDFTYLYPQALTNVLASLSLRW
ncbi:MAG: TonB-dependent receptor plug domain-containing protein [Hymenobacteraceae bacterium]|nr:TonB-dependent receptor plug domain-containing protein [Hymenobacteraceae bacterium]